jgi:hypothetical protein
MNYKLIGADQKEYGPVSAEQLRQWFTEGRVNAQTQIQPEGATDWKPLGSFPDLMPLSTAGLPPGAPAPLSAAMAGPSPEKAVRTPATLLLVVAGLGFLGSLWGLGMSLFGRGAAMLGTLPPDFPPQLRHWLEISMGPGPAVVGLLPDLVFLFGGLAMLKLQRWGLALAACILALVCGNPCCCPIGLVAGIWGLVVLLKPEIKSAFH